MTKKLLSIIVPVYNVEKYLERCLTSLESFLSENVEIILVDDGSTDKSGFICDKYLREDLLINVIHKENGGLSDARNAGISKAQGDYIWFIDSDDEIFPVYPKLKKIFESREADIICLDYVYKSDMTDTIMSHASLESEKIYTGTDFLKKVLIAHEYYVPAWSYIFKREYIIGNNFKFRKGIYHEDEQLTPYLLLNANSVISFKYMAYKYIYRENSIVSNKNNEKNIIDLFNIYKENWNYFKNHVADKELRNLLLNDICEKQIYVLNRFKVPKQKLFEYIDSHELLKYSKGIKNKIKAFLFIYCSTFYKWVFEIHESRK